MHQRRCLLLTVASVCACAFAPAPAPRTGVAEAVVNAFGGGPDGVRRSLEELLPAALQSAKVRGLACLRGERSPADWARKRLRVEEVARGGPVRVRLGGCRPEEALALLSALIDAYDAHRRSARLYEVEFLAAVRLQAQGGGMLLHPIDQASRRQEGPAVLRRPGLVSSGRSR